MKILAILVVLGFLDPLLGNESENSSTAELLKEIRTKLPQGWSSDYKRKTSWLEVSRNKKVYAYPGVPNANPGGGLELTKFVFAFRVSPKMKIEDYNEAKRKNATILKQAEELQDRLIARRLNRKFDSFHPSNPEEEKLVGIYEKLKSSVQHLPDFYYGDISLSGVFGFPSHGGISILDDLEREECEEIRREIIGLLTAYSAKKEESE